MNATVGELKAGMIRQQQNYEATLTRLGNIEGKLDRALNK